MGTKMLKDVKVLDFTINAAGPISGCYLADLGADVIKVEAAGGEPGRRFAQYVNGVSTYNVGKDRGKKSIEMNLKDPKAIELIKKNINKFDIVLNSFRPGVMDRMGLGYEDLKAIKPDIIYVQLSAFGSRPSKYTNKPAYDIVAAAMSGICAQTGESGGHPTRIGSVISDMAGGEAMFAATMTALYHHEHTGEGQFVDVSLLRNMIHLNGGTLSLLNKKGHKVTRTGNHNAAMSPYGIYTGKTMSMVIAATSPSTWNRLCECMNREDLKTDPRFAELPARAANHKLVEDTITDWLMTFDDSHEAYDILDKAGVPCCPVLEAQEVWEDEAFNDELGWWVNYPLYPEWEGSAVKTNKHCPFFADYSAQPCEEIPHHLAPYVGEQNYEILEDWGLSKDEAHNLLESWHAINL